MSKPKGTKLIFEGETAAILRPAPKPRAKPKRSGRKPSPLKKTRLRGRSKRSTKSGGQLFHGAKFRDPQYLDFVRSQPCKLGGASRGLWWGQGPGLARRHDCVGRVQACHLKNRGAGGVDRGNVVPMCAGAHDEQHRIGLAAFQSRWKIDLRAEALRLQALYEAGNDSQ